MNNRSARLVMNAWLSANGYQPISGGRSYIEFATALREILAPKQVQAPFVERADAVRYVQEMARQHSVSLPPDRRAAA